MEQKPIQHSEQFLRKRKMLLLVPLIVVPLLAVAFYGLGGGKGVAQVTADQEGSHGINMTLPAPHFGSDKPLDKMAVYHQADIDSAKWRERMKEDPYYNRGADAGVPSLTGDLHLGGRMRPATGGLSTLTLAPPSKTDSMADEVLERLEQLKKVIHQPQVPAGQGMAVAGQGMPVNRTAPDLSRMQTVLQSVKNDTAAPDPQMERINAMLDKLIKIQHPEASDIAASGEGVPGAKDALTVSTGHKDVSVATLTGDQDSEDRDGFISIDGDDSGDTVADNTIQAVINQDQTLVAGATVELRLTQDADISGVHVPKDNLIYGQADLKGERLNITVSSIRCQEAIYPVALAVYDLDGLAGIHIPGAITRDVSKESADEAINALGVTAMDPSLAGQAAGAGIQAAKDLLSRKVKLVRVSVKAGYQVLLKNTKIKNR